MGFSLAELSQDPGRLLAENMWSAACTVDLGRMTILQVPARCQLVGFW